MVVASKQLEMIKYITLRIKALEFLYINWITMVTSSIFSKATNMNCDMKSKVSVLKIQDLLTS